MLLPGSAFAGGNGSAEEEDVELEAGGETEEARQVDEEDIDDNDWGLELVPLTESDDEEPVAEEPEEEAGEAIDDPEDASGMVTIVPPGDDLEPIVMPEDQFHLQVRGLEERVTDLKERVFQTKARLMLLQESVIGGDLSTGARAILVHRNEMGPSFVLESVTYILDGSPVFSRVDHTGELDSQREIEVFNGRLMPGSHQIVVQLVYRGSGYGVFRYLNDYRFRIQSSHTFNAEGGMATRIDIVSFARGGLTTELQDRPRIRYEEEVTRELPGTQGERAQAEVVR